MWTPNEPRTHQPKTESWTHTVSCRIDLIRRHSADALVAVQQQERPNARGRDLTELRQAENKVKVSDPIPRRDIDILERYGSGLLQDAIRLRRAQTLRGEHPDGR